MDFRMRTCKPLVEKIVKATKTGDLDGIEICLTTLDEASVNKVISYKTVEGKYLETTPLFNAIENKREGVVQFLLEKWKPDLEQTVTMTLGRSVVHGIPPLWFACYKAYFPIVQRLLQHGADVNQCTSTGSSPLRVACRNCSLEIIQYLVEHGADINLSNKDRTNGFAVAAYLGRLEIVKYLQSKGAILDYRDINGETALHASAEQNQKDVLDYLLSCGAVMCENNDGLTPLMLAANNGISNMVEYIVSKPFVSSGEKIQALELLGSSYESESDMDKAFKYLKLALEERKNTSQTLNYPEYPSGCEPYFLPYRKDCHTVDDLETLRQNPNAFFMNCLAMKERLFGSDHVSLVNQISYRGHVYECAGDRQTCVDLWLHAAYILKVNKRWVWKTLMTQFLSCLCRVFVTMNILDNKSPKFCDVFSVLSHTYDYLSNKGENKLEVSDQQCPLFSFIYCVAIAAKINKTDEECSKLYNKISKILKLGLTLDNGYTALHVVLDPSIAIKVNNVDKLVQYPSVEVCKAFLYCGASVNARDESGNSPLHTIAAQSHKINFYDFCTLESCLIRYGAHIDAKNWKRKLPREVAATPEARKRLMISHGLVPLKCLAASSIMQHKLSFKGIIPATLEEFVLLH